ARLVGSLRGGADSSSHAHPPLHPVLPSPSPPPATSVHAHGSSMTLAITLTVVAAVVLAVGGVLMLRRARRVSARAGDDPGAIDEVRDSVFSWRHFLAQVGQAISVLLKALWP